MNKNRPSNILIYVFLSLVALIGLFYVGSFLETRVFGQGDEGAELPTQTLPAPVADGR